MTTIRPRSIAWLALAAAACGGAVYRPSYELANAQPKPPSQLVARKIRRPLYMVLDPSRVKDTWALKNSDGEFQLRSFHAFVRRDLKRAMQEYFEQVEVVGPGQPPTGAPHVVADVRVDDVSLHDLVTGALTYVKIEMTWSFALRPSEANDYAFSFGGTATSSESYPTFEAGCAQLVESAIGSMLGKWTEKGGFEALKKVDPDAGG